MSDMDRWLEALGLGEYAAMFAENAIDLRALPELTEEDLKEIGVKLGHRRILQRAVVELGTPALAEYRVDPTPTRDAERRQLTVMFCDLVDSVALGERMDVEDYRDLLARYRNAVVTAIEPYDGFVARHQGDGVLVYFGYPQAHEDDAERAVRGALDILENIAQLGPIHQVVAQARIGIATGPAVVGDQLESDGSNHAEFAALGATPNLAARLQGAAQPGTIIVAESTQQLTAGKFRVETLEGLALKGIESSIRAFRVLGPNASNAQELTRTPKPMTPLVGRTGELALALQRWEQARSGAAQAIAISAEPGIGKSRLAHEIQQAIGSAAKRILTLHFSPYYSKSPLFAFAEAIGSAVGMTQSGSETELRQAVLDYLASLGAVAQECYEPLCALLLQPSRAAAETGVSTNQNAASDAVLSLLRAMVADGPLLVIAEDLHWAEPTSLRVLGQTIERQRSGSFLLLMTYRPEFTPPWTSQPHLTQLALNHLTASECRELARQVVAKRGIAEKWLDEVVERTDGVALFVEELTESLSETASDALASDVVIPLSLRDALTARLDRLGDTKRLAQEAAVVGRRFRLSWLPSYQSDEARTLERLDALLDSGLVMRTSDDDQFEFKHALVRDTAYAGPLRPERERLHRAVGERLEALGDRFDVAPEVIANHFTLGGEPSRAVPFWQRACTSARVAGGFEDAIEHGKKALELLDELGERSERTVETVWVTARAMFVLTDRRREAVSILEHYAPMVSEVASPTIASLYYNIWGSLYSFLGNRTKAKDTYGLSVAGARKSGQSTALGWALHGLANEERFAGEIASAIRHIEESIAAFGSELDKNPDAYLVYECAGWNFTTICDVAKAMEMVHKLRVLAARGYSSAAAIAAQIDASLLTNLCEPVGAALTIERSLDEAGRFAEPYLRMLLLRAHVRSGFAARALEAVEPTMAAFRKVRSRQVLVNLLEVGTEVYVANKRLERARELADEAIQISEEIEAHRYVAITADVRVAIAEERLAHARQRFSELMDMGANTEQPSRCVERAEFAHSLGEQGTARRQLQLAYDRIRDANRAEGMRHVLTIAEGLGIELRASDADH